MVAEDNGALVCRAVEAIWNRGELGVADALFAAGYVNHGGLIPDLVRGPEAVKAAAALYRLAFPDLRVSVRGLRAEGDTVVLRWVAHGTPPEDPAGGVPAEPRGTLTGTTRSRLAGGRIVESWTYWDAGAGPRQRG